MPKAIPNGLTRQHVLLALKDLDEGIEHSFGGATGYHLLHEGKAYAPKAVVGIAFRHLNGTTLNHTDFKGGEGRGQANSVLSDLEFKVVPINNAFITSRGYKIPDDWEGLQQKLWFNMWQNFKWPYDEVWEGNVLFWYDSKSRAIVWKSKITKLDKFEYSTKQEMRERLIKTFDEDPANDPYFAQKANSGYCIAFKVTALERLNLAKPEGFKFPQLGWLRRSDPIAREWLYSADDLKITTKKLIEERYFDPTNAKDERERILREIVQRRGQPKFRTALIEAYGGRCSITGCNAVQALEAAHITPYLGEQSNHVSNGLLLRADVHTLYDLYLISVEPVSLKVKVAESLMATSFSELHNQRLNLPSDDTARPSNAAIESRWEKFVDWNPKSDNP
jgi:hypothetical protein